VGIRTIQIITAKEQHEQINAAIQDCEIIDFWEVLDFKKQNIIFTVLLKLENSQDFLDALQSKIDTNLSSKMNQFKLSNGSQQIPREELYNQATNDSILNFDYIFLTLLSTVVAALGLLQNHIIAVIAAMVIAPMLQPNIAMALAVILGDVKLLAQSIKTNIVGIVVCLSFSVLIGFFWPYGIGSSTLLLERSNVGYTSIILALASGAAAALSLTSRVSTVLVGVMVAVALLPPLVTTGILLGSGDRQFIGSGLLFFVNIVCVNLSANLIFIFKKIHPKKWDEKHKAKIMILWYLIFWLFSLLALCIAIYFHHNFETPR
jgi:uncharacterized hydrophobic protein (TIGR00341 family)